MLPRPLVDELALRRTITNLVSNAAKYATPGTPIRIRGDVREGHIYLSVEDTGPGIPQAYLDRVFGPGNYFDRVFETSFREEQRRTGKSAGTGLGLAICRWLVEEVNGGQLLAENHAAGARVTIRLPLHNDLEGCTHDKP